MTPSHRLRRSGAWLAVSAAALTACVPLTPRPDGNYVTPIGGSPVTSNPSPYSAALVCMDEWARAHNVSPPTIAVGHINDLTGALDVNGGRLVTQGAMLMAITALGKAGMPVVERYETEVPKLEYNLANNKLIEPKAGAPETLDGLDYRPIHPGQVAAADYFITGGITELNSNIRSASLGVNYNNQLSSGGGATPGLNSTYVLNIALDLRLVDTQSLRIVDMISYQKQIIGRQVGANLFAFFGNNVVSATANRMSDEPVHLAVRSLVERAVLEMVSNLYRAPGPEICLSPGADPLREQVVTSAASAPAIHADAR